MAAPISYRLSLDPKSRSGSVDLATGLPVQLFRGADAIFQFAWLRAGAIVPKEDFSNVIEASLVLRADNGSGALLALSTTNDFSGAADLTLEDWLAGEGAQFEIAFSAAQTNHAPASGGRMNIWWAVALTLSGGAVVTAGYGYGVLIDDGVGEIAPPPAPDLYYTRAQIDDMFANFYPRSSFSMIATDNSIWNITLGPDGQFIRTKQ